MGDGVENRWNPGRVWVRSAVAGAVIIPALVLALLGAPLPAMGNDSGHYPLYRETENRCLTVRSAAEILPGDRIFGGPYPLEEALKVLRERCPVPFRPSGDWFAVQRTGGCWLVARGDRLKPGDLVIAANVSRQRAERRLEETCGSFRLDSAPSFTGTAPASPVATSPVPPPAPSARKAVWARTSVPWIEVYSEDPAGVKARQVAPPAPSPESWKPLTPYVSLEPTSAEAVPSAVRVRLPSTVQVAPEAHGRVALAFFEESTSHNGSVRSGLWHLHTPDYDAVTGTYEAELHHASVVGWIIIVGGGAIVYEGAPLAKDAWTRFRMKKIDGDHFVLHYPSPAISQETARWTLGALEKARRFLKASVADGGAGVGYPTVPAKLDAYFISLSDDPKDIVYAGFRQGKSGGKWIDLNLPSNIPGYDRRVLRQTLAHELFHFVQAPWEGFSTFWDAWVGKAVGKEFPYGWLNEALSTAVELYAVGDPGLKPTNKAPIYNAELYNLGLKGLKEAKNGYSGGIFIDYLVHRYGRELFAETLRECKRQVDSGTGRNAYVALRRAVRRRSNVLESPDPAGWDPDRLWRGFAESFLQDQPRPGVFDPRIDRKRPYHSRGAFNWVVTPEGATQTWTISVPPLSLKGSAAKIFKVFPAQRDASGEARVDCEVTFQPGPSMPFDVVTPIHTARNLGKHALLPIDAVLAGTLDRRSTHQSVSIYFEKGERQKLLVFNPISLGAGTPPGTGPVTATYELTCRLHEEEQPVAAPVAVSTSAIDTYYWTLYRAAVAMKTRLDAHKPTRFSEVCSDCEARYKAARAEWAPIERKVNTQHARIDKLSGEAGASVDLIGAYYGGRAGRNLTPGDAAKIQYLEDVVNELGNLQEVCGDLPQDPFGDLYPLSTKGYIVRHPVRVESALRHSKRVPSREKVEKALRRFHESLGAIVPCEQQLQRFEQFWHGHGTRALQYIEELRRAYPGLQ